MVLGYQCYVRVQNWGDHMQNLHSNLNYFLAFVVYLEAKYYIFSEFVLLEHCISFCGLITFQYKHSTSLLISKLDFDNDCTEFIN